MKLNTPLPIKGCITQEKYLRGRTLAEIERILGFHTGRLSQGMIVAALTQIPRADQFEFRGYTQVAGHHYQQQYGNITFDITKAKNKIIKEVFKTHGPDRLVKVLPNIRHNNLMLDDIQYPPGKGVPQWEITKPLQSVVVAVVHGYPSGRFVYN